MWNSSKEGKEAYMNERQRTIFVVNACGPCDVRGVKIA